MTASTPEQDEVRRTAEESPAGSRQVRRRLTFGVAGDLADMPATLSPWQRADEAWRAAGLAWGHEGPPRERAPRPATRGAARLEAPSNGTGAAKAAPPKPAKPPAPVKPAPARPRAAKAKPDPHDVLVAGPPGARQAPPPAMRAGLSRRFRVRAAVGAGVLAVAGGAVVVASQGDGEPDGPRVPAPIAADALFAPDPAARTDGLVQNLTTVASAGTTIVAAGTEGDGVPGRERARFIVSADGGRTWSVATPRAADGAPPAGEVPSLVAGGNGRWVALGRSPGGGVVAWTSDDARTWTRRSAGAGFTPSDQVTDLARTGHGFVAVGASGGHAVLWSSADGRAWQRLDGGLRGIIGLDRVAASGDVVLAHGTYSRKITAKRGKKKVTRTVRAGGIWRTADGGRTWELVTVPQTQGSYGTTKGLAAGPGGFATVREGKRTTGRKKHRKTTRYGVLFTSPDGRTWRVASRFGGAGIDRFDGTPSGLAVVVRGAKGGRSVLRSADGRTWRPGGSVPAPVESSGLTVAGERVAVTGRQGDDAYLSGVDLRSVPGAVHPERSVGALLAAPGRTVAVGSANGGAAIWTAPDGRAWTRARFPGTGGRLADAVRGGRGWLAVGRATGARPGPLALTSQDGVAWQKAPFPGGPPPVAATAGPSGYVAVGTGVAWRSSDLRTWRRATLDGAPADVVATGRTLVAVGGRGRAPAIWTSPDGATWTPAKLPPGITAPLTQVAARGNTLVAIAADAPGDAVALVSTDAGATWAQRVLGPGVTATAVAPTPRGFAVAAVSKGRAAVLTSGDGTVWRRLDVPGLTSGTAHRLTALTTVGQDLVAAGTGGETPILWRAPVPE